MPTTIQDQLCCSLSPGGASGPLSFYAPIIQAGSLTLFVCRARSPPVHSQAKIVVFSFVVWTSSFKSNHWQAACRALAAAYRILRFEWHPKVRSSAYRAYRRLVPIRFVIHLSSSFRYMFARRGEGFHLFSCIFVFADFQIGLARLRINLGTRINRQSHGFRPGSYTALHSNQTLISPAHLFWKNDSISSHVLVLVSCCLAWLCLLSFPTTIHPGPIVPTSPLPSLSPYKNPWANSSPGIPFRLRPPGSPRSIDRLACY